MPQRRSREKIFEAKAEALRAHLHTEERYGEGYLPRPFFVEFTGSPCAGKTTTIDELYKFFRRYGFRVLRPQEGAEVIQHIPRTTPMYNIRTGMYALTKLLDISAGHNYDIVMLDRAIFDTYVWMMYWKERGLLSPEEKAIAQAFFLSRFWIDVIDAAYFMVCDPDIAMKREQRVALTPKLGESTTPANVRTLVNRYEQAFGMLSPSYPQLKFLDTTDMTEQEVLEHIALELFETFETKAKLREEARTGP
jgi:thymidylate kinase